jgi:hypothetical protein
VGSTLVSVAVGWGGAVKVTGVTESPVEEQAVNINNPIKFFNRTLGSFFMLEIKIL